MTLSEELEWRGFINQTTYKDISELDDKTISFYFGVDPSADSMTIGNLASAMMVRHFINYGHKAYLLVGGATGMIGDPDGKKDERNLKTFEEISKNKTAISQQYKRIFDGSDFTLVDNYNWFKDINYLDFLRNIGKYTPMTQLLDRDFVKSRIGANGSGISYAEFSYSLIQGYDFLHLYRTYGVSLQLCGADQWGNSIAGADLIRRLEGKTVDVFSTPLVVNKTTGKKFGKSEDGAIWLDSNKTSVYKFYQFWLNVDDKGVVDYLKIYTTLDRKEITDIENQMIYSPGSRVAQKHLAYEVTKLVHGDDAAERARLTSEVLFNDNSMELTDDAISILKDEIPTSTTGKTISSILTDSGVSASNGEARRLISGGAISVNGEKVSDNIAVEETSIIKKGKNNFVLVVKA